MVAIFVEMFIPMNYSKSISGGKKPDFRKKSGKTITKSHKGPGQTNLLFSEEKRKIWSFLVAAIVIFTFFLYLPSLKNGFLNWDDPDYIQNNIVIHQLNWEHIKTMFSSFHNDNYHPLTTLSYAIEYSIVGEKSAFLYHFNNLWIHLLNIILVFWFIRLFSLNNILAAIVAFWFGIHPMHVESVAWISERKDLLYCCFFIAGLISWIYFLNASGFRLQASGERQKTKGNGFYLLTLGLCLLSLLSKSAAVIFPIVLILIDFLIKRKFSFRMVTEKIPFLALALLFGILAMMSQKSAIQDDLGTLVTPLRRFFLVNWGFLKYIYMTIIPSGMSAFHPYPDLVAGKFPGIVYYSVLINLALFALVLFSLKYSRVGFFWFFFFLITILLVLQILPVGGALIAERYTYIPYIGLFYIMGFLLVSAWQKKNFYSALRIFVILLFTGLSVGFSVSTYARIRVWKDSLSLWDDAIIKYPGQNHNAYYLRGTIRKQQKDLDGALDDFNKSINLKPTAIAYNNRGNIFNIRNQYDLALRDYAAALKLDSNFNQAYNNIGTIKASNGDLQGGLAAFSKAISLNGSFKDAYRNRGQVRILLNQKEAALSDWTKAAALGDEDSKNFLKQYGGK